MCRDLQYKCTTIFNIVIDSIIRDCEEKMKDIGELTIQLYADVGFIGGKNHKVVQNALTLFEENFLKFGLLMNFEKTESMILIRSKPVHSISKDAYRKIITGIGESFTDKQNMTINCELCNMSIKPKKRRQLSAKCKKGDTQYDYNKSRFVRIILSTDKLQIGGIEYNNYVSKKKHHNKMQI